MKKLALVGLTFVLAGCATLKPGAEQVKIADPSQLGELKTCREIGKVTESSEYGRKQLIINLKNATAEVGGNVLVSKLQTEKTMGVLNAADQSQGKAFSCPPDVLAHLQNAEDF